MSDDVRSALDAVEAGPAPSAAGSALETLPAGEPSDYPTVAALRARFGDRVLRSEVVSGDQHVVYLDPEGSLEILRWLHDEPSQHYDFLADVTAVDYGGGRPIQVVYQLWSMPHRQALRVKCELPLNALVIESVVPVWSAANWLEREVFDLFGVTFTGHPDLRRILMPHNYAEGHPLRKDFPLRGRFSRAEQTRRALSQDPDDYYTTTELAIGRDPQLAQQADATASGDDAG